ncbi:type II toxin-antitoxin system Phd/YefM family antitoxin [Planktothrix agardhii]|uniref:type II toxin-antitoxin system Phd/YefM family antitoxin n=2 Tax=Planktothrix agardhii TaxID=1160 RepID=UPI0011D20C59|nr:prevent-host-death family protein [Planktothrix agardhii]
MNLVAEPGPTYSLDHALESIMLKISIENVGDHLKALLERVAQGEEIILVDGSREVARLVPPKTRQEWVLQRKRFRDSVLLTGESLRVTIIQAREGERY